MRAFPGYAVAEARSDAESAVLLFRQQGIAMTGRPRLLPRITSLQGGPSQTAAITDCVDSTQWRPVFAATGKSALAPGQPSRVVVDSAAMLLGGHWVIRTSVAHRDRPC